MKQLEKIEKALETIHFPNWITKIHTKLIEDWAGEEAIIVNAVINLSNDKILEHGFVFSEIRVKIHNALQDADISLWPYVRFDSKYTGKSF